MESRGTILNIHWATSLDFSFCHRYCSLRLNVDALHYIIFFFKDKKKNNNKQHKKADVECGLKMTSL